MLRLPGEPPNRVRVRGRVTRLTRVRVRVRVTRLTSTCIHSALRVCYGPLVGYAHSLTPLGLGVGVGVGVGRGRA